MTHYLVSVHTVEGEAREPMFLLRQHSESRGRTGLPRVSANSRYVP
jgi:hypothetical protein